MTAIRKEEIDPAALDRAIRRLAAEPGCIADPADYIAREIQQENMDAAAVAGPTGKTAVKQR